MRLSLDVQGKTEMARHPAGGVSPGLASIPQARPGWESWGQAACTASAMTWTAPTGSVAGCVCSHFTPQA